jgi:hypothetical protein
MHSKLGPDTHSRTKILLEHTNINLTFLTASETELILRSLFFFPLQGNIHAKHTRVHPGISL